MDVIFVITLNVIYVADSLVDVVFTDAERDCSLFSSFLETLTLLQLSLTGAYFTGRKRRKL